MEADGPQNTSPQYGHGVGLPTSSPLYVRHFTFTFLFIFTFHNSLSLFSCCCFYFSQFASIFHFLIVWHTPPHLGKGVCLPSCSSLYLSLGFFSVHVNLYLQWCWNHKGDSISNAFEVLQAHEDLWRGSWVFFYVFHAGTKSNMLQEN